MLVKQFIPIVVIWLSFTQVNGQTVRALLVAIDKYPTESGWNEIHATNDLVLIEPLLSQQGLLQKNRIILKNEQATKAAIVRSLEQLSVRSKRGDHIYIHFSCHGQQMADNQGDEIDKLDEALIPYDAPRCYVKGVYEGENHLRDDELEVFLNAIRRKIGNTGMVVLTLDACHSGTGDRDYEDEIYIRGTTYVFAPPNFIRPDSDHKPSLGHVASHPSMAPLTVIAACLPDQLNYEYRCPLSGNYYGSLTYALCRVWKEKQSRSAADLRTELIRQMEQIRPRKGKIQIPLLQTSDEKRVFRIGSCLPSAATDI